MGGRVLDYEAKDIYNAGRSEGWSEGIQLGRSEGIQLGRSEGIQLGRSEGIQLGRSEGIQLGRSEGKVETYISLIKDSILSLAEAAMRLGMSEEEVRKYM